MWGGFEHPKHPPPPRYATAGSVVKRATVKYAHIHAIISEHAKAVNNYKGQSVNVAWEKKNRLLLCALYVKKKVVPVHGMNAHGGEGGRRYSSTHSRPRH